VDTTPSWRTPHRFRRLLPSGAGEEVVTYGLVAVALTEAHVETAEGARTAAERFGLAPLAKLAFRGSSSVADVPYAVARQASVNASAADQIASLNVSAEFGKPFDGDPDQAWSAFVDEGGPDRLRDWVDDVRPLVAPVAKAADIRGHPPADEQLLEQSLAQLEYCYGRGLALERFEFVARGSSKAVWGFRFRDLAERAAVELFELYAIRPSLRRCELCGRVFVPAKERDAYCRFNLWEIPERVDRARSRAWRKCIAFCVPDVEVEEHNRRVRENQHTNRRKNLAQSWRRRRQRYGDADPRTEEALAAYRRYMAENRRTPGPRRAPPSATFEDGLLPVRPTEGSRDDA
jgi:hypothetical protein